VLPSAFAVEALLVLRPMRNDRPGIRFVANVSVKRSFQCCRLNVNGNVERR
jgi:hypothetical protein